jgi:hypothetical protein
MAKKLKLMSLFQELGGRAAVSNRMPVHPSTGMFLMQMRAQANASPAVRKRFMISLDRQPLSASPHPVKINHVRSSRVADVEPQRIPVAEQPVESVRIHTVTDP